MAHQSASKSGSSLRRIPAVNALLERAEIAALASRYSRDFITDLVREAVEELRRAISAGEADGQAIERFAATLPARLDEILARRLGKRVSRVINATGVIVHTNLGRAPLSKESVARAAVAASGYCDLEYDIPLGKRGSRQEHIEELVGCLFPGFGCVAVNNNAAGVLLALNTLADGGEVLISRGELVEIGGSFRIPEVMAKSGGILREVGTTNRTRIEDFEGAITDRTALILRVHRSNYRIIGFTEEASLPEMAALARSRRIPIVVDQGSGNLLDLSAFGLKDEPTVGSLLEKGADLVTFSGDKLLGGPQAGLLVGRAEIVSRMKANPLYRALRPDKATVAALEATLESFVAGNPLEEIPVLRMLSMPAAHVRSRAEALARRLVDRPADGLEVQVEAGVSRVGGGAAPMEDIPTFLLALKPRRMGVEAFEAALRLGRPPVIARVREGWLLVDLRTISPDEETSLAEALLIAAP